MALVCPFQLGIFSESNFQHFWAAPLPTLLPEHPLGSWMEKQGGKGNLWLI